MVVYLHDLKEELCVCVCHYLLVWAFKCALHKGRDIPSSCLFFWPLCPVSLSLYPALIWPFHHVPCLCIGHTCNYDNHTASLSPSANDRTSEMSWWPIKPQKYTSTFFLWTSLKSNDSPNSNEFYILITFSDTDNLQKWSFTSRSRMRGLHRSTLRSVCETLCGCSGNPSGPKRSHRSYQWSGTMSLWHNSAEWSAGKTACFISLCEHSCLIIACITLLAALVFLLM